MKAEKRIREIIEEVQELLIAKNRQYGNSALKPIGVFANGSSTDLIKIRIDDKLNRLIQGDETIEADEDIVKDLIGYFVLLLIAMRDENV